MIWVQNARMKSLVLSLPVLIIWPNIYGAVGTVLLFNLLQRGIPFLNKLDSRHANEISKADLCEFIEVLLLGITAGLTVLESLKLAESFVREPLTAEITKIISRCNFGMSLSTSLAFIGEQFPKLDQLVRIMTRSEVVGAPIAESLALELSLNRSFLANETLQRVRSLSVKCVMPLGLCFLPAFFLLTIVPIVASLLPNIMSTFS